MGAVNCMCFELGKLASEQRVMHIIRLYCSTLLEPSSRNSVFVVALLVLTLQQSCWRDWNRRPSG
jgi:hypothetical protein